MSRKYLYPILTVLIVVALYFLEDYVSKQNEHYPEPVENEDSNSGGEFGEELLPSSTTGVIVEHTYFTLSYSEEHEQAEWVAYPLLASHLSKNEFERPDFVEDRKVRTKSAHWKAYKNSGYDRGHLCPAGDRRFSFDAYHETFLTSNISPQINAFNAGIWNDLEQKVRYWARKFDGVYVVTGGVLQEDLKTIGLERVSVPDFFYKIILDRTGNEYRAIALMIPNAETDRSLFDFVVPIDEIESVTGIDFFSVLESSVEARLESTVDIEAWNRS